MTYTCYGDHFDYSILFIFNVYSLSFQILLCRKALNNLSQVVEVAKNVQLNHSPIWLSSDIIEYKGSYFKCQWQTTCNFFVPHVVFITYCALVLSKDISSLHMFCNLNYLLQIVNAKIFCIKIFEMNKLKHTKV